MVDLQKVMKEVEAVVKKYDVGAHIVLTAASEQEGRSDYKTIFPSWSVAQFEPQSNGKMGIRVRAKVQQRREVEDTVRMFVTTRDVCHHSAKEMQHLLELVKDSIQVESPSVDPRDPRVN